MDGELTWRAMGRKKSGLLSPLPPAPPHTHTSLTLLFPFLPPSRIFFFCPPAEGHLPLAVSMQDPQSKDRPQSWGRCTGRPWPCCWLIGTLWLGLLSCACAVEESDGACGSSLAEVGQSVAVEEGSPPHSGPHPCRQTVLTHGLPTAAPDVAGKGEC